MLAQKLRKLLADNRNNTVYEIIKALEQNRPDLAYNFFAHDGDKIPTYMEWGKAVRKLLDSELGCRIHGVKNCQARFCKTRD